MQASEDAFVSSVQRFDSVASSLDARRQLQFGIKIWNELEFRERRERPVVGVRGGKGDGVSHTEIIITNPNICFDVLFAAIFARLIHIEYIISTAVFFGCVCISVYVS